MQSAKKHDGKNTGTGWGGGLETNVAVDVEKGILMFVCRSPSKYVWIII